MRRPFNSPPQSAKYGLFSLLVAKISNGGNDPWKTKLRPWCVGDVTVANYIFFNSNDSLRTDKQGERELETAWDRMRMRERRRVKEKRKKEERKERGNRGWFQPLMASLTFFFFFCLFPLSFLYSLPAVVTFHSYPFETNYLSSLISSVPQLGDW